jgi:hypothetical protein
MVVRIGVVLGLAALVHGCSSSSSPSCDRSGCDAVTSPASGTSAGIAGVVAYESDVGINGCHECLFDRAEVEIWKVDAPTSPAADVASIAGRPPVGTVTAAPSFNKTLGVGTYVVCTNEACVEASVQSGQVTTVNILLVFGPVTFWTDSGSGQLERRDGISRPMPAL